MKKYKILFNFLINLITSILLLNNMTEDNNNSVRNFLTQQLYPLLSIFKYVQYILNIISIIILFSSNNNDTTIQKYLTIIVSIMTIFSLVILYGQLFINNIDIFNIIIVSSIWTLQISGIVILFIALDTITHESHNKLSLITLIISCLFPTIFLIIIISLYYLIILIASIIAIFSCVFINQEENNDINKSILNNDMSDKISV